MQKARSALKGRKGLLGWLFSAAVLLMLVTLVVLQTTPAAQAATVNVANLTELTNAINAAPTNGTEHIINVTANIDNVTSTLNIAAGKNITLNISPGVRIFWNDKTIGQYDADRYWMLDYDINQKGPLINVAAGATLSLTGGGELRLQGKKPMGDNDARKEKVAYMTRTTIANGGTLNVINAKVRVGYPSDTHTNDYMVDVDFDGSATMWSDWSSAASVAVAIRNAGTGTVNMTGGSLVAYGGAFSFSADRAGHPLSISVGIQNDKGGTVNMSGGLIDIYSRTSGDIIGVAGGSRTSNHDCHAWGIINGANGKTLITGGTINTEAFIEGDGRDVDSTSSGTAYSSSVAVGYTGTNYPKIYDLQASTVTNGGFKGNWAGKTSVAVGQTPTGMSQTSNTSGQFKDENGYTIPTGGSASLAGGMMPNKVKVAVYYRFWNNTAKTGTPQIFTGDNAALPAMLGNVGGTTFVKLGDSATNPGSGSKTPYAYTATANQGYIDTGRYIGYSSGGLPANSDYFYLYGLSYDTPTTTNRPDHTRSSYSQMTEFNRYNTDPVSNIYANGGIVTTSGTKLYVYVDYVKQNTYDLRASLSTDPRVSVNTFTMTYQNRPVVVGTDIPLNIFNTYGAALSDQTKTHKNITSAFNLNTAQTAGHLNVTYKYKVSTAGDDTYVDGLPKNANTYKIRAYIPSDTDYSINGKNVTSPAPGYFEFTLIINRAQVNLTVNDPFTVQPTYGTTLGNIPIATEVTLQASSIHVLGSLSWDAGSNVVPNVATGSNTYYTTSMTFTPSAEFIGNYAPRTFQVNIKILPKPLKIYAGNETNRNINVIYGNWPTYTAYYEGLAANDLLADGKTPKESILTDLDYKVQIGGQYVVYKSTSSGGSYLNPDLSVGTYPCQISGFDNTNYTVTYENGSLVVGKRTLTVTAVAPAQKHFDGTFDVDISLTSPKGNAAWNSVGYTNAYDIILPQTVVGKMESSVVSGGAPVRISLPTLPALAGPQAGNYNLAIEGLETLTTVIVRAKVLYVLPTIATAEYNSTRTLNSIALPTVPAGGNYNAGRWVWDDTVKNLAPTVGNTGYKVWFIPEDSNNYDPVEEKIVVPVTKKQVEITAVLSNPSQTVYYGDAVPGLKYSFTGFTGTDNETNVTMSGNYSMNHTYTRGSAAGTYPITVTLNNLTATNYSFVAKAGSLTVARRPVTITPQTVSKEYGYTFSQADFTSQFTNLASGDTSALFGTITYTTSYSHSDLATRSVKEGGYPVNASASITPANYTITYVPGVLNITKAELKFTAGNKENVEFGSPTPDISNTYTVTGYKFNETALEAYTGSPKMETTYLPGNPVDTYDITIQRNNLASVNYNITIELRNGYLTVVPATPTVSVWPTASIVYTQSLSEAQINTAGAVSSTPGTYSFAIADYKPDYTADQGRSFSLVFTPANQNYKSIAHDIPLTILQKEIDGSVSISGSPIVGDTLMADLGGMSPADAMHYTITWHDSVTNAQLGTGSTYAIQSSDSGRLIYVKLTALDAYSGTKVSVPTSTVISATGMNDVTLSLFNFDASFFKSYVYNSSTISFSITKKPEFSAQMGGTLTVKYNNSTVAPKDAGTYRVTIDITAGSAYKPAGGLYVGTFTIEKAPLAVHYSPANKIYDGNKKATTTAALTHDVPFGGDDVTVNAANATYAFASENASNNLIPVRVSGAVLTGRQAGNYYIDDSQNYARIEKRAISVTALPVSRVYDPANYAVAVNFSPNYTGVLSADRNYVSIGNGIGRLPTNENGVGFRTVQSITANVLPGELGDRSGNYSVSVANLAGLTVEITKATPTFAIPVIDPVTYDYERPLSSIRIDKTSNNWSWVYPNEIPQVINEGYLARYTPGASQINNYKTVDQILALIVNPKTVVMQASVQDAVVYGSPVPRVRITYQGINSNEDENEVIKGGPATFTTTYYQFAPVGEYPIIVDTNSVFADNYTFTYDTANPAKISVNPAPLSVTAAATERAYIPNNRSIEVSFGALTGKLNNDDVFLASTTISGEVVDGSVGQNKRVYFDAPALMGEKARNYEVSVTNLNNLTVNISKATPTGYAFPSSATVEFGSTLAYAKFINQSTGDLGGYFYFERRNDKLDIGKYTDYIVVYQPGDANNYESVRQTVYLDVIRATKTFNLSMSGTLYVGETLQAVVSGLDSQAAAYAKYSWYRINPATGDPQLVSEETKYVLTSEDLGYRIMVKVELLSPYSAERTVESSRTIEEVKLTFWQKFANWWYTLISAISGLFGKIAG